MQQQNTKCQQDDGLLMDESYYAELEAYFATLEEPYEPILEYLECERTMAKYNGWYDDEYVLLNPMPCDLFGIEQESLYEEGRAL